MGILLLRPVEMAFNRQLSGRGIHFQTPPEYDAKSIKLGVSEVRCPLDKTPKKKREGGYEGYSAGSVIDVFSDNSIRFEKKSNNKEIFMRVDIEVTGDTGLKIQSVYLPNPTISGGHDNGVAARITVLRDVSVEEMLDNVYFNLVVHT